MGASDTAKEVIRIAATAGLAKDVIDLLEKKASLLAEQVTTLEQENTTLLRENRNLALENQNLKGQAQNVRPKGELNEQAAQILKFFFVRAGNGANNHEIADGFKMAKSMADYHLDVLWKKRFVTGHGGITFGEGDVPIHYEISPAGGGASFFL